MTEINGTDYTRGDSMILIFHMPPLAKGQGLSDIDRVWFRVTQKNFKIMESSNTVELNR